MPIFCFTKEMKQKSQEKKHPFHSMATQLDYNVQSIANWNSNRRIKHLQPGLGNKEMESGAYGHEEMKRLTIKRELMYIVPFFKTVNIEHVLSGCASTFSQRTSSCEHCAGNNSESSGESPQGHVQKKCDACYRTQLISKCFIQEAGFITGAEKMPDKV